MKEKIVTLIILMLLVFLSFIYPTIGIPIPIKNIKTLNNSAYHYFTYPEMTDLLHNLQENHSDIMTLESIGETYEGRDIWMVKLSDNVQQNENEPGVLFMAAHHGNEKASFEVLIYFIRHMVNNYSKVNTDDDGDDLINEDPIDGIDNDDDGFIDEDPSEDRIRDAINNTQIFIIPMVSPDGVVANSRKNCAPNYGSFGRSSEITSYGVNLNRNYDDNWFLYYIFPTHYHFTMNTLDQSFNYRGPYPFSENETIAVKNFVERQDISISLSFHSFSEVIIYPWMHTSKDAPHEEIFISVGENMSRINNYYLYTGRNYIIPRYGGTLGSSENWLYREQGILSFTMELCREYAPSNPDDILSTCYNHIGVNLYICERSLAIEEEKLSL
ncbi:M14 family zinc carboxypeptidase [Thermoplasmatota archaeon]